MSRKPHQTQRPDADIDAVFQANQADVPADLDASILRAAQQALSDDLADNPPAQSAAPSSRLPQWFGLAASIALVVMLLPLMLQSPESSLEGTDEFSQASHTAPAPAAPEVIEHRQNPSPGTEQAPTATTANQLTPKANLKSRPLPTAESGWQNNDRLEPLEAMAPSPHSDNAQERLPRPSMDAPAPKAIDPLPQAARVPSSEVAIQPRSRPAGEGVTSGPDGMHRFSHSPTSVEAQMDADASDMASGRLATGGGSGDARLAYRQSAETWIGEIESLTKRGLLTRARQEYAEFRAVHPRYETDFKLPEK